MLFFRILKAFLSFLPYLLLLRTILSFRFPLLLFWEFFLPFLLKLFLSFFLIWGSREILGHFQIGKGCSSVLNSYVLDSLWSKKYHHNLLLMGKENDQNPLPNELWVRLCQWEVLQGLLYTHTMRDFFDAGWQALKSAAVVYLPWDS